MLEPIGNNVLLMMERKDETTKGGIILPEFCRDHKPNEAARGMIISVGDKAAKSEQTLRPGYIAITTPHQGTRYTVNGTSFLIIATKHILATIEPEGLPV